MSKPIKKTGSPYYHYDFILNGQRLHGSTKCSSLRDAERFIAKLRREVLLGEGPGAEDVSVDRGFGLWWEAVGVHLRNWRTDEYRLLNLVEGLGPKAILSKLTLRDFDAYVAKRRAPVAIPAKTHLRHTWQGKERVTKEVVDRPATTKRLSAASINRELQLAKRVFRWLAEDGRGYKVPRIAWKSLMLSEPKERVRELSAAEEERLFAALPGDLARLALFAMLSGQRRTELVELKWSGVDFDTMTASVVLKGGAPHQFPLTPLMVEVLEACPRVAGVEHVFTYEAAEDAPTAKGPAVVRLKGKRYPFSKQGWTRRWRRALAEAGISNFRFHDLRHTAATRLVRASGSLKAAQRLLGHTDIKTTARYAHATDDDVRLAMERSQKQPSRKTPEEAASNVVDLRTSAG